jgi:hypothetical protein
LTNQSQYFQTQVCLFALRNGISTPYCPNASSSRAVPESAFVVVFCTLQLDSMLLAHSCAMRRPGGACDVHSLNAYRILEHARLSRGKTITLKCLRLRSKPFIAPMTMHNPLVIMRMYCEAFVVRALRAERKKTESRESTLCTPESPVIVESVSDLVPYWTFSD